MGLTPQAAGNVTQRDSTRTTPWGPIKGSCLNTLPLSMAFTGGLTIWATPERAIYIGILASGSEHITLLC
jgi:hypothetical protein